MKRVLIFTGDGKGKTTAALGMVLRAAGHGQRVLVVQFIKANSKTGELAACPLLPGVELVQMGKGFLPKRDSPKFKEHCDAAQTALDFATAKVSAHPPDLLVLDEVCTAVARAALDEERVLEFLHQAEAVPCIVMTGRGATARLIECADTVTEMKCVRHALQQGVKAQAGVEY